MAAAVILICGAFAVACGSSASPGTAPSGGTSGVRSATGARLKLAPGGRIAARIDLQAPTGVIARGMDSLWVDVGAVGQVHALARVSPQTDSVIGRPISINQTYALGVAAGSTGGVFLNDTMQWLNPRTGTIGAPVLSGCGNASLSGDAQGSVWYLDADTPPAGQTGCPEPPASIPRPGCCVRRGRFRRAIPRLLPPATGRSGHCSGSRSTGSI